MKKVRRILFATDFSEASGGAFRKAAELARRNRAELLIAHVLGSPSFRFPPDGWVMPRMYEEMEALLRAQATKSLRSLVERARITRAKALLLKGLPHRSIAQAARSHRADLIVVGTHGRSGAARLILGSVAARVLATAPCPVLTVRGR